MVDYYDNGKFLEALAKEEYIKMMERFRYPIPARFATADFWVQDFGLNLFPSVGVGGIIWCNEKEDGYFSHEVFLLPNQCVPEHSHVKMGSLKPKKETWHVRAGKAYIFSEGDNGEYPPFQLPELINDNIICKKWVEIGVGEMRKLDKDAAHHFLAGGPEGLILSEYGTFHDDAALKWHIPGVSFSSG